jgi:hypothetical protein
MNGVGKLVEYGQMRMNIPADKKYIGAIFYVLNKIKKDLLFDPEQKRIVDYDLDINIKWRTDLGLMDERAILQKFRNDGIISDVGEADIIEGGEKGTPQYEVSELYHFKISDEFDGYYDVYQKKQIVMDNYCWFDNNTFFLLLRDGSPKAISFDTERGTGQMLALFQTIIEHWKQNESEPISGSEIVKVMARFGSKVATIQLKNIISNVRNKKIKPAGLEDKIHIEYDRKADGWRIDIKR